MTIREATTDDVESIQSVAEASWEADYPGVMSRETLDTGVHEWYSSDRIRESLYWSRSHMLVAERDDEIAGFVHADLLADDGVGHILRLYVAPEHRRQGIGGDLLEAACRALFEDGADHIRATVLASNDLGNEFYREFGFEPGGTETVVVGDETYRETTYDLREDAMVSIVDPVGGRQEGPGSTR